MIRLEGAELLRELVLQKWRTLTIRRRISGYVTKFPCPDCGGEACEAFRTLKLDDRVHPWWGVEWSSDCGYVADCLSSDDACLVWRGGRSFIEVEEKGVVVGLVDPSSPLPWRRYETSEKHFKMQKCARFGTLWQSLHAGVAEHARHAKSPTARRFP
jgi:hypothetical protein